MQHKNLTEIFETEMWLYLDNELSEERMKFWEEKIPMNVELQQMLNEANEIFTNYSEHATSDIENSKYETMIDRATSSVSFYEKIKLLFTEERSSIIPKVALASILIITAIVFQLISTTPNSVNTFSKETLSWNDESLDDNVINISTNISFLENEDFKKYYIYTRIYDEWEHEVISVNQEIEKLLDESGNYKL